MSCKISLPSLTRALREKSVAGLGRGWAVWLGAVTMVGLLFCGAANAQCSYDLNGVGYGAGCTSGGGGGYVRRAPDPAAQERAREYQEYIRQQHLKSAAHSANNRGIADYKKGNYAKALQEFRDANRSWPEDLYMRNIQLAADQLGIRIDQEAERKLAAVNSTATTQLTEAERKAAAILAKGSQETEARGTGAFGIAGNPDKPALAKGTLPEAHVGSVLEQASSMANSGGIATGAGGTVGSANNLNTTDPEVMKAISGCGSDTNPCAPASQQGIARPSQSAAASELANRLPDAAKNDPTIQQRMKEYDSSALHRQETEQKIAVLDQKIKAGDPNAEVLKAYQADLVNQAAQDKKQENDTKDAIQNQMQNLGLDWVEQPAKSAAKS